MFIPGSSGPTNKIIHKGDASVLQKPLSIRECTYKHSAGITAAPFSEYVLGVGVRSALVG